MSKQLYPQKSLILCEKVSAPKRGNIIVPDDKMKGVFGVYKVVRVGEDIKEYYKKGEVIIVDEEHLNSVLYENEYYYFIDDGFVVSKVK